MGGLIFVIVALFVAAGLGYEAGQAKGWHDYFEGRVECAKALDQIVCKEKTK